MNRFLPTAIAGNLRYKFIAYSVALALVIGAAVLSAFLFLAGDIVGMLGKRVATNQVLLDRARAELPLVRELTLAETLAGDPAIIAWSKAIDDPILRRQGLATLERFRNAFQDHSYFFVPDATKAFYAHEAGFPPGPSLVKYTLSESNPDDAWYFSTTKLPGVCYLNVDFDRALHETKVWFNCNVRDPETDAVLGIVGSGIELTEFIDDLQKSLPPGVTAIYVDKDGAIQAHPDITLIEQDALTKPDNLKSTIFNLVETDEDRTLLAHALDSARNSVDTAATVTTSIDGRSYLIGISFIPEIDWYSISVMDLRTLAFGKYFIPVAGLIAIAILLSTAALGIALSRTVLRRVDRLDEAVVAFKKDNALVIMDAPEPIPDQLDRLRMNFDEMSRAVRRHTTELEQLVSERTRELQELVGRDSLTNLRNRRAFHDFATEERLRAERFGGRCSVLMFDLDHFKSINDKHGHAKGDEVLKSFAGVCEAALRDIDVIARIGGEEFAAVLINTSPEDAVTVAERISAGLKALTFESPLGRFQCTVSIGIVSWEPAGEPVDVALKAADTALYEAKDAGRDRIVVRTST